MIRNQLDMRQPSRQVTQGMQVPAIELLLGNDACYLTKLAFPPEEPSMPTMRRVKPDERKLYAIKVLCQHSFKAMTKLRNTGFGLVVGETEPWIQQQYENIGIAQVAAIGSGK